MLQQYNSYDLFFREKKEIKRKREKKQKKQKKTVKNEQENIRRYYFIMYD